MSPKLIRITEGILTLAVMAVNRIFLVNGTRGILNGTPNMNTLVTLGSGVSFIYSAFLLFRGGAGAFPVF